MYPPEQRVRRHISLFISGWPQRTGDGYQGPGAHGLDPPGAGEAGRTLRPSAAYLPHNQHKLQTHRLYTLPQKKYILSTLRQKA